MEVTSIAISALASSAPAGPYTCLGTDEAPHRVSILTPTHQRVAFLERVWSGLMSQTCREFEWVVSDDGSTDGTGELVRQLAALSDFPVLYVQADCHVGKVRMDNEAVRRASGEFIVWCDSDDYLLPGAIRRLLECWESIPVRERKDFVGVTAQCTTSGGTTADPFPGVAWTDVSWNDLAAKHHVKTDMLFFVRADALRATPFPEVDLVIPESVVWSVLGHRKSRLISEVLMYKEYQGAAGGLSFSGVMSYNRGRAYALAQTAQAFKSYPSPLRERWWQQVTFLRYALHGELGLRETLRLWRAGIVCLVPLSYAAAYLLVFRDALQGKVRKTHREFLAAREGATITAQRLSCNGNPR